MRWFDSWTLLISIPLLHKFNLQQQNPTLQVVPIHSIRSHRLLWKYWIYALNLLWVFGVVYKISMKSALQYSAFRMGITTVTLHFLSCLTQIALFDYFIFCLFAICSNSVPLHLFEQTHEFTSEKLKQTVIVQCTSTCSVYVSAIFFH